VTQNKTDRMCPEGRISQSTRQVAGRDILDLDTYIPFFLVTVNSALSRGASTQYRKKFGVGIVDWRIIAMLAIEQGIMASRICEVIALDKAATSRALKHLAKMGLVRFVVSDRDPRKRRWWLSDAGEKLHDEIMISALERERMLIKNVAPDDLEAYLRVMRQMRSNLDSIAPIL